RVCRLQVPERIAQLRGGIVAALGGLTLRGTHIPGEPRELVRELLTIVDERLHAIRVTEAATVAQAAHSSALLALLLGKPRCLVVHGVELARDVLLLHPRQRAHSLTQLICRTARSRVVVLIHGAPHFVLGLTEPVQRLPRARRGRILRAALGVAGIPGFLALAAAGALTPRLPAAGSARATLLSTLR